MNDFAVDLQLACDHSSNPPLEQFQRWFSTALAGLTDAAEVSIRLVEESESQALNSQFRGKDKPTNVLSFPFELPEGVPADELEPLLGDLIICSEVVAREASQQGKPIENHWAHMVVHGTLHLLGYDHINDDEAEVMEQLERDILARLSIADPYQDENEV